MTPEMTVTLFSNAVWLIILMVAVLVLPVADCRTGYCYFSGCHTNQRANPELFTTLACHSAYGDILRSLDAKKNHGAI